MMRVLVDLQSCQSGSKLGGIGRYSYDLLTAMVRQAPSWDFHVLLNGNFADEANELRYRLRSDLAPGNMHSVHIPHGCAPIHGNEELLKAAESIRENFIAKLNPDVLHISSLVEGLHEDVVTSIGRAVKTAPVAVTLYDLIPMRERKNYLSHQRARSHYFKKVRDLSRADCLFAISQYSADEMLGAFPEYSGVVVNIKGGIDPKFKRLKLSPEATKVRSHYGLSRKFLLYTASFDQRKNQTGLITAFSSLPEALRSEYQLVFVGGGDDDTYHRLTGLAVGLGIERDQIKFLGRVSDENLIWLYNLCDLFVFPPKWEGLGMPALEAMACGAPVIGSGTSSISEVIGLEEALFDPNDTKAIASKIKQALTDEAFRTACRAHGRKHVDKFQWANSARIANETLAQIVEKYKKSNTSHASSERLTTPEVLKQNIFGEDLLEDQITDVSFCAVANDAMFDRQTDSPASAIGWITSWNSRCGISANSQHLVAHSSSKPVIFASYNEDNKTSDDEEFVVRCWQQGKSDPLVDLEQALNRHNIQTVFIQFNYGFFNFESLKNLVLRLIWAGRKVFFTLHSTVDQTEESSFKLNYLRPALSLACGLFVHSYADVSRLAKMGLSKNVTLIPLGLLSVVPKPVSSQNQYLHIATYGFMLPGKGLLEIVEAVGLLQAQGKVIELTMVNARYPDPSSDRLAAEIEDAIQRLGISQSVKIVDSFLSDSESLSMLNEADLIIFPYTRSGESASAAVRTGLASGKPVAVTPLKIFDDVRDAVITLPGSDVDSIVTGLRQFYETKGENPDIRHALSVAARWASCNSYKNVATHTEQMIAKKSHNRMWSVVSRFNIDNPFLSKGTIVGKTLQSSGPGVVCYGPYARLSEGHHKLVISGRVRAGTGKVIVRITKMHGAAILGEISLDQDSDGVLAALNIEAHETIDAVELVFEVHGDAELTLRDYEISKLIAC